MSWPAGILPGDREGAAVELLRRSFAQGNPSRLYLHFSPDYDGLRDYPPFQELVRPKG